MQLRVHVFFNYYFHSHSSDSKSVVYIWINQCNNLIFVRSVSSINEIKRYVKRLFLIERVLLCCQGYKYFDKSRYEVHPIFVFTIDNTSMRVNLRFCLVDQRLKVGNGICKGDKFRMKRWSFVGGGGVITRCFGLCNELIA